MAAQQQVVCYECKEISKNFKGLRKENCGQIAECRDAIFEVTEVNFLDLIQTR